MVRTESRTSMVLIQGKAGLVRSLSERFSPACGPEPSGGGSMSRLVSPTSLRSTRMSAPSSRTRPILTSPRNSETGSRNMVSLRTRARSGREPQVALVRVTPSATMAGSGAELDGQRHAGGQLAAGHLADLLGHAALVAGQIARADPDDPADRGDGHSRRENPGQPPPGNAHCPPILAQSPSIEKPNASTVRRK